MLVWGTNYTALFLFFLFIIYYLLFIIYYLLFIIYYLLFIIFISSALFYSTKDTKTMWSASYGKEKPPIYPPRHQGKNHQPKFLWFGINCIPATWK